MMEREYRENVFSLSSKSRSRFRWSRGVPSRAKRGSVTRLRFLPPPRLLSIRKRLIQRPRRRAPSQRSPRTRATRTGGDADTSRRHAARSEVARTHPSQTRLVRTRGLSVPDVRNREKHARSERRSRSGPRGFATRRARFSEARVSGSRARAPLRARRAPAGHRAVPRGRGVRREDHRVADQLRPDARRGGGRGSQRRR